MPNVSSQQQQQGKAISRGIRTHHHRESRSWCLGEATTEDERPGVLRRQEVENRSRFVCLLSSAGKKNTVGDGKSSALSRWRRMR
ncbi:uncharacterized protein P884DRAFT_69688 [Thermothelomyces heterothallicus CBS 202.75]|uniref:uncharacterized protein n=1 Tax=Thermothelomyces heterothallicus CBS 202.75 TaxID=1149848 RepID=UPI00374280E0